MPYKFDYNQSPEAIILACQQPGYDLYDLGTFGDLYRNRDLIELFEGVDVLAIQGITPRFAEMKKADSFSEAFEARRAGEVIRWALDRALVERCAVGGKPAWRILDREMQYLAIGPAARQRVIRIRGLKDPVERGEANKLANREYKRRDRARAKEIERQREAVGRNMDTIMALSPDMPLPDELGRFRVMGPATTFAEARLLLIDAAADGDGWLVLGRAAGIATDLRADERERARAVRDAVPVSLPDDDADAMGDIGF